MRLPAIAVLVVAAGCHTDDPPPDASSEASNPPTPWRADSLPVTCRPELLNEGLPYREAPGAVHLLAWATVADDYWESERTQAVVVKQYDQPPGRGHRWVLALVYYHQDDPKWPWQRPFVHFGPPPPGHPPVQASDAQR